MFDVLSELKNLLSYAIEQRVSSIISDNKSLSSKYQTGLKIIALNINSIYRKN